MAHRMNHQELQTFVIEHSEPGMDFTVQFDKLFTMLRINGIVARIYNASCVSQLPHDVKLMQDGYLYCCGYVTKNSGC
jgi:hypothetical protein